jgi:integrase
MGRSKKGAPPRYCHHKATGRAYVTLGGKPVYLGPHGSAESRRRYQEVLGRWAADQSRPAPPPLRPRAGGSVAEVVASYLDHAKEYYRTEAGEPTSGYVKAKAALAGVLAAHGGDPAEEFAAADLEAVRAGWVRAGHSRGTCNEYAKVVRRCWRWARRRGWVSRECAADLDLDPLEAGRTRAPDYDPVPPAPPASVAAVLGFWDARPESPRLAALAAMVRLQLLSGARPGEVCRVSTGELGRDGRAEVPTKYGVDVLTAPGCWCWVPGRHKVRRKRIVIYCLGPRAQALLGPWLKADPAAPLFRNAAGHPHTPDGYAHLIARLCRKLGVEAFAPNRLRHTYLTEARRRFDLDMARASVGHADQATTTRYAQRDLDAAGEVARRIG